ncbi:Sensory box histidine kinase/response regulator [Labilithrix luteola]|uniref:Sensory box histidine kinase/response regulator n=1 Tax=Labilithrix luteola TaxID=1391654 RepID=A0A0K1Q4F5_9BACT|nr:response regulator [Labilithrix luteola]AKV00624.1 Sensory box histidine kinase/response regulator [Labilithrix luteola]
MTGNGRPVGSGSDKAVRDLRSDPAIAVVAPCELSGALRRGRVLVVDDEPMIAQAVRRLLLPEHDVEAPASAAQALAMLADGARFDVIVLDVIMPRLSGPEFYERLVHVDADQANRVVFVSGGAVEPKTVAFLASVDNPKLDKPVSLDALRDVVNGFVARGNSAPAS